MIVRRHEHDGVISEAHYSECMLYRYALTRVWEADAPKLLFVMLNPSTASELANDPTVERCQRRATALGYGGFRVCNIFAWRETHPAKLRRAEAPLGPENDAVLQEAAGWADLVLCAWGAHGSHLDRGRAVAALLRQTGRPLAHLGLTQAGHPRHPLYVAYAVKPMAWDGAMPGEDSEVS